MSFDDPAAEAIPSDVWFGTCEETLRAWFERQRREGTVVAGLFLGEELWSRLQGELADRGMPDHIRGTLVCAGRVCVRLNHPYPPYTFLAAELPASTPI